MEGRKDQWKPEEDILLTETVLNHIKSGSTQLKAFEEVAEQLSRTPAACGFRWNSDVRKGNEDAIKQAKQERLQYKQKPVKVANVTVVDDKNDKDQLDTIVDIVQQYKLTIANMAKQIKTLTETVNEKEQEIEILQQQIHDMKPAEATFSEDYATMLEILKRARDMGLMERIS